MQDCERETEFVEDEAPRAGVPEVREMIQHYGDGPWWKLPRRVLHCMGLWGDDPKEFSEDEAATTGMPPVCQIYGLPPLPLPPSPPPSPLPPSPLPLQRDP